MKSIYKIQLTNLKGNTTVTFSVERTPDKPFLFQYSFNLIIDDNDNALDIIKTNPNIRTTQRVFLFYKDSNGNDQTYIHSRLDWTKEQLIDYLRSRSYNSINNFFGDGRCNKIMGIESCGDDGPGDENSEWQNKTPFLKWKEACSSAGQLRIDSRTYDVSYLCCNDTYDSTCTVGCRRDERQVNTCFDD